MRYFAYVAALLPCLLAPPAHADVAAGLAAMENGDYAAAYRELFPLADGDDTEAQRLIGVIYRDGLGVAANYDQAIKWFSIAGAFGSPAAQLNLGNMYDSPRGVVQDHREAVLWYRRAAEQGHGLAPVGCVRNLMQEFIESGTAEGLDAECLDRVIPTPFFLSAAGPGP